MNEQLPDYESLNGNIPIATRERNSIHSNGNDPATTRETEFSDPTAIDPTAVPDPTAIVAKARRTQVKLTSEKLLSDKGLPYIMKNAPKRLRISSRKNAYDNLTNIAQFYQLWAHELYPKAKFRDFTKLCYTLGRSDKILREYRANLYRDEMGINMIGEDDIETRDQHIREATENENDRSSNTPQISNTSPTLFEADSDLEISRPPYEVNGHNINNDEDDDIYSLSTKEGRKKAPQLPEDDEQDVPSMHKVDKASHPPVLGITTETAAASLTNENPSKSASNEGLDDLEEELMKFEKENLTNLSTQTLREDDVFSEDEDALEAMQELGF